MIRRKARETLERKRDLMVAALWANSNYDQPEVDRAEIIGTIEARYAAVINSIYDGSPVEPSGLPSTEEIEPGNPFFDAMRRGLERPAQGEDPLLAAREAKLAAMATDKPGLSALDAMIEAVTERDEG
jgi:hypothetical protein